jgi:hypothetical protein
MGWRVGEPPETTHGQRTWVDFVDSQGQAGRLHWRPMERASAPLQDLCWAHPVPANTEACRVPVPGPSAMLIDLLAGIVERETWTLPLLLADLRCVITHPGFDWQHAHQQARRHGLAGHLRRLTECLSTDFGTPVPDEALADLRTGRITLCEQLEWRLFRDRQLGRDAFFSPVRLAVVRYLRQVQGMGTGDALAAMPAFLRQYYGAAHLHQVAGRLVRNGLRRVIRTLRRRLSKTPGSRNLTQAGR